MEVEFQLDEDDYRALYRYLFQDQRQDVVRKQLPWYRLEWVFAGVLLACDFVLIGVVIYFLFSEGSDLLDVSAWLTFGFFFLLINAVLFFLFKDLRLGVRGHTRIWLYRIDEYLQQMRNAGELDPDDVVRAIVTPHNLVETTERTRRKNGVVQTTKVTSTAPWCMVGTIDVTAEHAFFKVGESGWLILPKMAFDREEEFFKFVAMAKRFHEESVQS